MYRQAQKLNPEFGQKLNHLLTVCDRRGVSMRPYTRTRSPFDQARLWRQSRPSDEIIRQIAWLRDQGAPFIADCIDSVGPQQGPYVTDALPGLSWHQWGEAADCLWMVAGQAEWSFQKQVGGVNGYRLFAEEAAVLGLAAGGLQCAGKKWPHIQLRPFASPDEIYSLVEIDREMQRRFGGVKQECEGVGSERTICG